MNIQTKPSIRETLKSIDVKEDKDIAFIFASVVNIYIESLRRLRGRVMLGPNDIPIVLNMVHTLVQLTPDASNFTDDNLRSRELTDNEAENLLKGIVEEPKQARRA